MRHLTTGQLYRLGGDVFVAGSIGHTGEEREVLFDLVAEEDEDDFDVFPDIVLTVDQVGRLWRLEDSADDGRFAGFWGAIGVTLTKTNFTVGDLVAGDIDLEVWGGI